MNDYRLEQLNRLIELHNESRQNKWLWKSEPLKKNSILMSYAQRWANKLAINNKLFHSDIKDIIKLGFTNAGENIAWGQNSPDSVMKSWMNSSGHKKNILNNKFTDIGCGMSLSEDGKLYWCCCFGRTEER